MEKRNNAERGRLKAAAKREALKRFMAARGLNTNAWSNKAGRREGTLRSFLNGNTQSMRQDTWEALADAEHITVAEMLTGDNKNLLRKIPIVGSVPGDNPCDMMQAPVEDYVYFETSSENAIALKMVDDSMNQANLPDGCFAIIDCNDKDVQKLNGNIVILIRGGKSTCKRLKLNPLRFCSESTNSAHEDFFPKDGEEWSILGKVIGSYIKF